MRMPLRRFATSALVISAVAGAAAIALPAAETADWLPISYGLGIAPDELLPPHVSPTRPVRVVSTALDHTGRPVVTARTATDRATATNFVTQGQNARNAVGVELDSLLTISDVPTGTDPDRGRQWDFAKLHVAGAWPTSTGAGVTVAVLDSGVDGGHPDLAGHVLTGYDELTGTDGANTDPNGHGTHVAGTIAAVTGNNVGISAIAPDATILPVRVVDAKGEGFMSDAANGIVYAADHGADVINMSLGSKDEITAVTNAVAYARSKGVVVVAAAGNERTKGSPVSYPAATDGVIAVAATDSSDTVTSFSNRGGYVDVAAPGAGILSTVPAANGSYATYSGTSMASPHVAAVAALIRAKYPRLTPDQVESALETSATDLGAKGKDSDYGYGRIDALAALKAAGPATPVIKSAASATTVVSGTKSTVGYTVSLSGKAWARRAVRLSVTTAAGTTTTAETTDASGKVSFARKITGRTQVKLVVLATGTSAQATSPVVTFTVRAG
ncbi:peptidase S8 [Actinoplanes sp. TBRC 11911]|uniref:S8 family peptidase n=1 Tax=Actinoplanes sp. TBRC 11911 TaxID=2729386 RepID=UPI00145C512B|nr:S8 family peptidase [Actinoplanes sp. TBRC 11911]NMO51227.1 peptidase S8 [Actinoplanes sp. TBRC 11911]